MVLAKIKKFLNSYYACEYGSFRGYLRTKKYSFFYYLGRFDKYRDINWKNVNRLVFVCKGNICRSAFAEAVAKSFAMESASFGLDASDNSPADNVAICSAKNKGVSLDNHVATSFDSFRKKTGDLYIVMEPSHLFALEKYNLSNTPITLAGLWCKKVRPHIEDPYGKSPDYFNHCFNCIEKLVRSIVKEIRCAGV